MTSLPPGWVEATIADLATYVQRGKSPKYADASDLPVVNQKCVRWWGIDEEHVKFVHPNQRNAWSAERFLRPGDLLWNSTGTGTIGRAALFQGSSRFEQMVVDSHVTIVRTTGYEPKLLHNWIASPAIQGQIHRMHNGSTNQVELSRGQVLGTKVPVPPLNEQRRIVDKIEALNAKSRRAKEALDAIPPLLEKFRQSILAAAFRGDLTADWRVKNPDVDPASKLLERIRTERRRRWEEAELEKLRAKGSAPKDDRWKAKYQEPAPVDTEGLPELPEGWVWATVDEVSSHVADCPHSTPPYETDGYPAIRTADVQPGKLLLHTALRVSRETLENRTSRLRPCAGDVLYTREGERFGLAANVPADTELCLGQRMMMFRPYSLVDAEYVMWAMNSPGVYSQAASEVGGSTSPHVNVGSIRAFHFPLAPRPEQTLIAERLQGSLRRIGMLAEAREQIRSLLSHLESSVLAKAFRGELVPQDPNDEPASVVLERIRAEREGQVPASSLRIGGKRPRKRQAAE